LIYLTDKKIITFYDLSKNEKTASYEVDLVFKSNKNLRILNLHFNEINHVIHPTSYSTNNGDKYHPRYFDFVIYDKYLHRLTFTTMYDLNHITGKKFGITYNNNYHSYDHLYKI